MPSTPDIDIHDDYAGTSQAAMGAKLDADHQAIMAWCAGLLAALEETIRDDDTFQDASVRYRHLHQETIQAIQRGLGSQVLMTPADASVTAQKIVDGDVTTAKIALLAITTALLADKAVTLPKMADVATRTIIGRQTAGTGSPESFAIDDLKVVSDGSTAQRDLSARFGETVNVRDYGAAGDGVTNDYASFAAAIAALPATGGRVVVPYGKYILGSALNVGSKRVEFAGFGWRTLVSAPFGNAQWLVANTPATGSVLHFTSVTDGIVSDSAHSCQIDLIDIAIVGPGSGSTVGIKQGSATYYAVGGRWSNVLIANWSTGARILNTFDSTIINALFRGCATGLDHGANGADSNQNVFFNLRLEACTIAAKFTRSQGCQVYGGLVQSCITSGLLIDSCIALLFSGMWFENPTISGDSINLTSAISASERVEFHGCRFSSPGGGDPGRVHVTACVRPIFRNCFAYSTRLTLDAGCVEPVVDNLTGFALVSAVALPSLIMDNSGVSTHYGVFGKNNAGVLKALMQINSSDNLQIGNTTLAGIMQIGMEVEFSGGWQKPIRLGAYRIWAEAATGKLRIKGSAPVSDSDGTVVGTQT